MNSLNVFSFAMAIQFTFRIRLFKDQIAYHLMIICSHGKLKAIRIYRNIKSLN